MTQEQLLKRRSELISERQHKQALVHVIDGAIQDCDYWLAQFNNQELNKEENKHE